MAVTTLKFLIPLSLSHSDSESGIKKKKKSVVSYVISEYFMLVDMWILLHG